MHFRRPDRLAGGGPGVAIVDLITTANLDIVNATVLHNRVVQLRQRGRTFSDATNFFGGQSPADVAVAESASLNTDGTSARRWRARHHPAASGTRRPPSRARRAHRLARHRRRDWLATATADGIRLVAGTLPLSWRWATTTARYSRHRYIDDDGVT
jgi:hypothetical protein